MIWNVIFVVFGLNILFGWVIFLVIFNSDFILGLRLSVLVVGVIVLVVFINNGLLNKFCKCLRVLFIVGWVKVSLLVVLDIFCLLMRIFKYINRLRLMCLIFIWLILFIIFINYLN